MNNLKMQTKSRQLAKNRHDFIHNFEKISMDNCGAFLQYKQDVKNSVVLKNIAGRRKQCIDVMIQSSLFV